MKTQSARKAEEEAGKAEVAPYDRIQVLAYAKWLAETSGRPVSQEESDRFWLEAEAELVSKE